MDTGSIQPLDLDIMAVMVVVVVVVETEIVCHLPSAWNVYWRERTKISPKIIWWPTDSYGLLNFEEDLFNNKPSRRGMGNKFPVTACHPAEEKRCMPKQRAANIRGR